jgi:hypothetical protein
LLMRNIAPTVMTAGLAKPATASNGERIPVTIKTTMTPMAVRSTGSLSVISRIKVMMRIPVTIQTIMGSPRLNKVNNKGKDYSSFSF